MKGGLSAYWNTVRYLKPIQLYGRIGFRLSRPRPDLRPAPLRRSPVGTWQSPARRAASLVGREQFRFLNETHDLADHGWDDSSLSKLWRYNLHYFDDLNAQGAQARSDEHRALMSRWVRENSPGIGSGWEPYPASLRIVNWIKWALGGNAPPDDCLQSLAVQTRWLSQRLERHLLGNHLFSNAKALVMAGVFFDGPEANGWLATGFQILERELPEQILADGGHFERSPMYHALALEDMLDLYNVAKTFPDAVPTQYRASVAGWPARIGVMREWLAAMCHPDGEIGFFNDAAIGIAPSPEELDCYAQRLGFATLPALPRGVMHHAASGYVRVHHKEAVALLDVAPIGPDYLPAHAHADTLSFELSVLGQRIFVNSGTSQYGNDAERHRQRGTRAHNTVVVDGENSSEVWGGFRVARRARPQKLAIASKDGIVVRCAHDGYRRLPGKPEHRRHWMFNPNGLIVEDHVSGTFEHAEARFHLHPAITVVPNVGGHGVTLVLPEGQRLGVSTDGHDVRVEPSTWHPEFGVTQANQCLVVVLDKGEVHTTIRWGSLT